MKLKTWEKFLIGFWSISAITCIIVYIYELNNWYVTNYSNNYDNLVESNDTDELFLAGLTLLTIGFLVEFLIFYYNYPKFFKNKEKDD